MTRRFCFFVTTSAIVLAHGLALAQPNPNAETLFREGRKLMEAKDYAAACPKFAESQKLEPAAGTLLNLADCYEKDGKMASAWNTFKEAARAAAARNRNDWATTATQRATTLEPKLAMLTISVAPAAASTDGLRIERDGVAVDRSQWGTAMAVDPGSHTVAASAPGKKTHTSRVDVAIGNKATSEVGALESDTAGPDEAKLLGEVAGGSSGGQSDPWKGGGSDDDGKSTRLVGYVLAGAGAVGLVVGTFTGVRALSLRSDAASHCTSYPDQCGPDASSPNSSAKTMATVSTISLIAGAALVVGGIVLVVTAPKGHTKGALPLAPVASGSGMPVGWTF